MRLPLLNLCSNMKCLNFLSIYSYVEVNWKVTWPKIRNKLDITIHDPEKKSLKLEKKKKKPGPQIFLDLEKKNTPTDLSAHDIKETEEFILLLLFLLLERCRKLNWKIHFCWEIQARLHIHTNICKFELEVTMTILFSISNSLTQIQSWVAEGKSALEI